MNPKSKIQCVPFGCGSTCLRFQSLRDWRWTSWASDQNGLQSKLQAAWATKHNSKQTSRKYSKFLKVLFVPAMCLRTLPAWELIVTFCFLKILNHLRIQICAPTYVNAGWWLRILRKYCSPIFWAVPCSLLSPFQGVFFIYIHALNILVLEDPILLTVPHTFLDPWLKTPHSFTCYTSPGFICQGYRYCRSILVPEPTETAFIATYCPWPSRAFFPGQVDCYYSHCHGVQYFSCGVCGRVPLNI